MSAYKAALNQYLATLEERPNWDRLVPEKLCGLISNLDDFKEFLSFVSHASSGDYGCEVLEFRCDYTSDFFKNVAKQFKSDDFKTSLAEENIDTELGQLAYAMILAMAEVTSE